LNGSHRCNEPIAPSEQDLDVPWLLRVIAQSVAKFAERGLDAVVVFHRGSIRPELAPYFVLRNQLAGTLQQEIEDLNGLSFQPYLYPMPPQLPGVEIERKWAKTYGV
jgi:hypothetical protein